MAFADFERLVASLRCPTCGSVLRTGKERCRICRRQFLFSDGCVVFPSDELPKDYASPSYASSNPYQRPCLDLIEKNPGGMILDLGAGKPRFSFPNVVQLEIRRYATTDVVATEGRLPFANDSMDGVISQAVLEHVRDPQLYVDEILRVLKPGARCVLDAAFLQPFHGAPAHYFNTTHRALEVLFRGFDVDTIEVGPHQHPWIALAWFLESYLKGLSPADKEQLEKLPLRELMNRITQLRERRRHVKQHGATAQEIADRLTGFNEEFADELGPLLRIPSATRRELAAGFEVIARKPVGRSGFVRRLKRQVVRSASAVARLLEE